MHQQKRQQRPPHHHLVASMSVIRSTPLRPSEQGPVLNLKGTPEAPHRDSLQRGQQRGGAALNERKTAGMKKALRAAAWRRAQARARPTQPSSVCGEFARLNPSKPLASWNRRTFRYSAARRPRWPKGGHGAVDRAEAPETDPSGCWSPFGLLPFHLRRDGPRAGTSRAATPNAAPRRRRRELLA